MNNMNNMGGGSMNMQSSNGNTTATPSNIHTFDPAAAAAVKKKDNFSGSISNDGNVSSNASFSGNMQQMRTSSSSSMITAHYDPTEFENEPPLMEELGINILDIKDKTMAVLLPFSAHAKNNPNLMDDDDLFGPLIFGLLLGGTLMLSGKLHFGYIYGFGMFGCLGMGLILNLMSPNDAISMWRVVSVLGYGLLPVNLLAALNVVLFLRNRGAFGMVLAVVAILWCTSASTRLFERSCDMRDQRYLIAYPTALVYCCFVIITVF